jgi:hypothetical protein
MKKYNSLVRVSGPSTTKKSNHLVRVSGPSTMKKSNNLVRVSGPSTMKKSNNLVRVSGTAGPTAFGLSPTGDDLSSRCGDLLHTGLDHYPYAVTRRRRVKSPVRIVFLLLFGVSIGLLVRQRFKKSAVLIEDENELGFVYRSAVIF